MAVLRQTVLRCSFYVVNDFINGNYPNSTAYYDNMALGNCTNMLPVVAQQEAREVRTCSCIS